MSKYILTTLLVLLISFGWLTAQTTVTIGTGTNLQRQPFGAWYGYERSAAIYRSSDINALGTITHLGWYVGTAQSASVPTKIYLKTTSTNTLTSSTWANIISGATEVYNASRTFTPSGWLTIDITDFNYSANNLLVLCETNYGGSGTVSYPTFRYSNSNNSHQYWAQDGSVPTGDGSVNNNRPNIQITFKEVLNPTSFTATPVSASQIDLGWTKNAANNDVMVAWNSTNSFGTPVNGSSYNLGSTIGGSGTVLYTGSLTAFNHSSLSSNTSYYYRIWSYDAVYDYSSGVSTNATTYVGSYPWNENFDSVTAPTLPSGWTVLNVNADTYTWGNQTTTPNSSPNAMYIHYNASQASNDWLVSPGLYLEAGTDYIAGFAYRARSATYPESMRLNIAASASAVALSAGTQLYLDDGFVHTVYYDAEQYFTVPSTGIYYLGWHAFSAANQWGIYLDDVSVQVAVPIPGVSETSIAFGVTDLEDGSPAREFRFYNLGGGTLNLQGMAIQGGDADQFELVDANSYPIGLARDEYVSVTLYFRPDLVGAKTSDLNIQDDLGKNLYSIPLSGHGAIEKFRDGFESATDFSLTLPGWTQYDGDGSATYHISGVSFLNQGYTGSYIAFNPSATTPPLSALWNAYDGARYAACLAATTPANNDWLISPAISFGQNPVISFYARSITNAYGLERFKVLWSTTGNSYSDFTNYLAGSAGTYVEAPTSWTNYVYTLPPACENTNVYIAIQCVSNKAFSFQVDNFVAGDYGQPQFHISPSSYVFEDFFINYTREQLFTVTNNGGGSMQVVADGITISGDAYFKLKDLPALPITLGAGQSFSFTVYYNSPRAGSHSATLSVTDNLSKAIHTVAISGSTTDNTITQKPYMEGFEPSYEGGTEFQVQGWVRRDNNGDGYPWLLVNDPSMAKSGNWLAVSQSWAPDAKASSLRLEALEADATTSMQTKAAKTARDRLVLNPDNWLISPPITISAGDSLNYWIGAYSDTWYAEHYALLISTGDPDPSQFTTTLTEETLTTDAWQYRAFNLDAWDGQTVYFAFRHYNCTDQLALRIDDVKIKADNTEIYQDYVGDPVQGDNYFKITMQQNIQDEMNLIPLTVEIEGWLPEASNLLVTGSVGYAQPQIYIENAGLTVLVNGVDMAGATVRITHNLGYLPLNLAYRSLSGNFSFVTPAQSSLWTTTQVEFLVPAAKAGEGLEIVFPDTDDSTLPVELSSFTVSITGNFQIQLLWVTQSETNLLGYQIYRGESDDFARAIRLEAFIMATNTSQQQLYAFTDTELCQSGKYYYWLEHLEMDGSSHLHGPVLAVYTLPEGSTPGVPVIPGISSIYPNPFNPDTTIRFGLKQQADYRLSIYNLRGQLVRELDSGSLPAGYHKVMWNGRDQRGTPCPSGIYLLRMSSGSQTWSGKLVLAK